MTAPEPTELDDSYLQTEAVAEEGPYAGLSDLQRIESKLDTIGEMLNGIVLTVSNAERAIMSGPMGKMIAGRAAANGRQ